MTKIRARSADGYLHIATRQDAKERQKNSERIARKNLEKQICLNCPKPKCKGAKGCFERSRGAI